MNVLWSDQLKIELPVALTTEPEIGKIDGQKGVGGVGKDRGPVHDARECNVANVRFCCSSHGMLLRPRGLVQGFHR
ncbi:hypothetical protein SAMN05216316_1852 [Nitrosovibrio sp. Nv6]|nr:hypothetical protein SAMN05216316_1852 [Nitrosovibrio sp. Nv6]